VIQVEAEGKFQVQPICILDRKEKTRESSHKSSKGPMDLIQLEEATWEHDDAMQVEYPHLFVNF
jgi:hypothetical protein